MYVIYFTEFNRDHGDYIILNTGQQDLILDLRENSRFPVSFLGLRLARGMTAVAVLTK